MLQNKFWYHQIEISLLLALFALFISSCSSGSNLDDPFMVDPPQLVSSTPEDGALDLAVGDITIVLTYDQNVTSPSSGHSLVTLGNATINSVSANLKEVIIKVTGLEQGLTYKLVVPVGVVLGPTKVEAPEVSIQFSTIAASSVDITASLSVENPSQQVQELYNFLKDNYGEKIISSTMANVNWNINEAEWVKQHTGKYPAMATFDYIHLMSSPTSWIDYSNTAVVEDWWNSNGIVSACWHWNVPTYSGSADYTYEPSKTTFKASNATIEGTWENDVVKADLEEITGYLKLLQAKSIPVIWRPLHEAAGNIYEYSGGEAWFWWGRDGSEAYKALWIYMFDYFETQGLNNLIWVWNTQINDNAFYPGDNYVDIVGRDAYNEPDASSLVSEFNSIQETYPHKMVTLSECGGVANISDQWSLGAKWSYFMPWYDYERTNDSNESDFNSTDHEHANAAWWIDAFNSGNVLTLGDMPDWDSN